MANSNNSNGALLFILGLLIGAGSVYFYLDNTQASTAIQTVQTDKASAKVQKVEGLYVFINSEPEGNVIHIDNYQSDIMANVRNLFGFKDKDAGDKLRDLMQTFVFSDKLRETIRKIKTQFPDAEAVIFDDKLDMCRVVKFD